MSISSTSIFYEVLDYQEALKKDENLKILVEAIDKNADVVKPNLGKYSIGSITLTLLNFTSCSLRIDGQRNLYLNDIKVATYTENDCHLALYHTKQKAISSKIIYFTEKDDKSTKITTFIIGKLKEPSLTKHLKLVK